MLLHWMKWIRYTEMFQKENQSTTIVGSRIDLKGMNLIIIVINFTVIFITVIAILEIIWYFVIIVSGFLKVDSSVS